MKRFNRRASHFSIEDILGNNHLQIGLDGSLPTSLTSRPIWHWSTEIRVIVEGTVFERSSAVIMCVFSVFPLHAAICGHHHRWSSGSKGKAGRHLPARLPVLLGDACCFALPPAPAGTVLATVTETQCRHLCLLLGVQYVAQLLNKFWYITSFPRKRKSSNILITEWIHAFAKMKIGCKNGLLPYVIENLRRKEFLQIRRNWRNLNAAFKPVAYRHFPAHSFWVYVI